MEEKHFGEKKNDLRVLVEHFQEKTNNSLVRIMHRYFHFHIHEIIIHYLRFYSLIKLVFFLIKFLEISNHLLFWGYCKCIDIEKIV